MIKIEININDVVKSLENLQDKIENNSTLMRRIASDMKGAVKENFDDQGRVIASLLIRLCYNSSFLLY